MKRIALAWAATAWLAGCAVAPSAPPPPLPAAELALLADARFPAPSVRVDANDLFALSAPMKAYLKDVIGPKVEKEGRLRGLVDALYNKSELKLTYDATMTRNAAEAFDARAGNCLSLVIMTAAFARELDLSVNYQKVMVDDAIGREGDMYFAIGHVNLTLGRHMPDDPMRGFRSGKYYIEADQMTIDFLPSKEAQSISTRPVGEATIAAMYLNNRAVETLSRGEVVDAYWWAREAVRRDPSYLPAVNTLGVVYARHQDTDEAERALRHVLVQAPGSTLAISNLVAVLAATGRVEESQRLAETLARIDPEPPFSWYFRGMDAMRRGDLPAAKEAFAKEVARAPDFHEFHFWLAIAYLGLGQEGPAQSELKLALETSTSTRDHALYASKLAKLSRHDAVVH